MDPSRSHASPSQRKRMAVSFEREKKLRASQSRSKSTEPQTSSRQSRRKTKSQLDAERVAQIENAVRNNLEVGIEAREIPNKGRGVFSTKNFKRGDFICEYAGDLIKSNECAYREKLYGCSDATGSSYMFYFKHNNELLCVDATEDRGRLGRLTNHSRFCNMTTKVWTIDTVPRLLLMAKFDIPAGVELTIDYGDRSKAALKNFVWLKQ